MRTDIVGIEKLTRTFTAGDTRFVVTAEITPNENKNVAPYLTVDLEPISADAKGLSITADIYEKRGGRWVDIGGGQSYEELRKSFPDDPDVARLCDIWQQYHLCDMKSGTRQQNAAINAWVANGAGRYGYTAACAFLANAGLLDVPIPEAVRGNFDYQRDKNGELPTMYRYGSAWLAGSLPVEVEAELRQLMTAPAVASPEEENRSELAARGIKMSCEWADRNPNMSDFEGTHYKCTFSRGRRRMTVYFSMGYAHTGEPTINQVWDCITQDAEMVDGYGDFHEFCNALGYNEDSRAAERTWKASIHQAARLKNFLEGGR